MKTCRAAALALVLLLAGCGLVGTDEAADEGPRPEPVEEVRLKTEAPAPEDPAEEPAEDPVAEEPAGDPAADAASSAALDLYVAGERAALENMAGLELYAGAEVEAVYPSTVKFTYIYADAIDPVAAVAYFDTMSSTLEELCTSVVFPAMTQTGVVDPAVTYAYYNPDGSLIWEQSYASAPGQ